MTANQPPNTQAEDELDKLMAVAYEALRSDVKTDHPEGIPALNHVRQALLAWRDAYAQKKVAKALHLYETDMRGYDFMPEEDGEDTNALVHDALQNSKVWVLAHLQTKEAKESK